jgi:hypothetical protein
MKTTKSVRSLPRIPAHPVGLDLPGRSWTTTTRASSIQRLHLSFQECRAQRALSQRDGTYSDVIREAGLDKPRDLLSICVRSLYLATILQIVENLFKQADPVHLPACQKPQAPLRLL